MANAKLLAPVLLYLSLALALLAEANDDRLPGRELLLLQDIPMVITAAKVAQPVLESPSAITVLTEEDIRRYGITSFSDIMRNVPGVDIISMSYADRNIGIRGLNQTGAGKILALVDNRPINIDPYGEVRWEFLPVSIDEIERIEIIRGPGSALYGANAFDGVINIITKKFSSGAKIATHVNHFGKLGVFAVHSSMHGNLSNRMLMGRSIFSGWDDEEKDAGERRILDAEMKYAIGDLSALHLSGGIRNDGFDMTEVSGYGSESGDATPSYIKMDYMGPSLNCHLIWDWSNTSTQVMEDNYKLSHDVLDFELQHSLLSLSRNSIIWGLNFQFAQEESDIIGGKRRQSLIAGYFQDQIRLFNNLTLTTGLRYDRHQLAGSNLSPRFSVVYSPGLRHAMRASAGQAFRNPPFIHSYTSLDMDTSIPMLPYPVPVKVRGNKQLEPEQMTSFELGYRGVINPRFKGEIDLFFNRINGLTRFDVADTYDKDVLFPGSPGGIIPSMISAFNVGDVEAKGGEVSANFSLTRWLSANANYSYQYLTDRQTGEEMKSAPRHKLNSGFCINAGPSLLVSLFANHVDRTVWEGKEVKPYTLLNAVAKYKVRDLEFTFSVSNLLNNRYVEHPAGDEIGRSAVLSMIYEMR